MQLFVMNGTVIAYYSDDQTVPTGAHPNAVVQSYSGEMSALGRVGDLPEGWPAGAPDPRPYAAPAIDLAAYAAQARYAKEVGGIVVSGLKIATDDRSKIMISGARQAADANSSFTTPFVGADGTVTVLDAAQVIALSNAILAHVQACFSTYATVMQGIASGSLTTTAQIDKAFAAAA